MNIYLADTTAKTVQTTAEVVKNLINENGSTLTLSTGLLLLPSNNDGIKTSEYLYAGNSNLLNKLNISAGLVFEMIK